MKNSYLKFRALLLVLMAMLFSTNAFAEDETLATFSYTKKGASIPEGWTGEGTSNTSTGNYYFMCSDGSLTSPSIDFTKYSSMSPL